MSSGLEVTTSSVVVTGSGATKAGWRPGSGWSPLLPSPAWRRTAWCGGSARPGTAWWSQTAAATGTTSASSSYSQVLYRADLGDLPQYIYAYFIYRLMRDTVNVNNSIQTKDTKLHLQCIVLTIMKDFLRQALV